MASTKTIPPSLRGLQVLGRARDVSRDEPEVPTPQERLRALNAKIEAKKAAVARAREQSSRKEAERLAARQALNDKWNRESAEKDKAYEADRKRYPWKYWFPAGGGGGYDHTAPLTMLLLPGILGAFGVTLYLCLYLPAALILRLFGVDLPAWPLIP